ncbi:hypothetical protein J4221_00655 [Candidatus Pacearchaeota archaeon]|nr:hypothetical protein [Candidatus Pacearchaeota archaeon]
MAKTEIVEGEKSKSHHFWLYLTILFLVILSFLIYTSFYNPSFSSKFTGKITGNIISNKNSFNNIIAKLDVPGHLVIDSSIDKISIKTSEPLNIVIGDQKAELKKQSSLVINDFKGKIILEKQKLTKLDGNAQEIFIDGIPMTRKSGSSIPISIEKNVTFYYLELKNTRINTINYIASGDLDINNGKVTINLKNEKLKIDSYEGDFLVNKNVLSINGKFSDINADELIGLTIVKNETEK